MAGGVSAGAYTGGVLDYLIQVLDKWEEEKKRKDPSVPKHEISIEIISGASAGGITGAMATLAFHMKDRYPVTPDKRIDTEYLKKNVFYNAWVNLVQNDMIPVLLDTSDIEGENKAVSLLNSAFIEEIATRKVPQCTEAPPRM
jgi:predicted acylesterase/phospholipase RssA